MFKIFEKPIIHTILVDSLNESQNKAFLEDIKREEHYKEEYPKEFIRMLDYNHQPDCALLDQGLVTIAEVRCMINLPSFFIILANISEKDDLNDAYIQQFIKTLREKRDKMMTELNRRGRKDSRAIFMINYTSAIKQQAEKVREVLGKKDDKFIFMVEKFKENKMMLRRLRDMLDKEIASKLKQTDARINQSKDRQIVTYFRKSFSDEALKAFDKKFATSLIDRILTQFVEEATHLSGKCIIDFKIVMRLCELRAMATAISLRLILHSSNKMQDPFEYIYYILEKFTRHPEQPFDKAEQIIWRVDFINSCANILQRFNYHKLSVMASQDLNAFMILYRQEQEQNIPAEIKSDPYFLGQFNIAKISRELRQQEFAAKVIEFRLYDLSEMSKQAIKNSISNTFPGEPIERIEAKLQAILKLNLGPNKIINCLTYVPPIIGSSPTLQALLNRYYDDRIFQEMGRVLQIMGRSQDMSIPQVLDIFNKLQNLPIINKLETVESDIPLQQSIYQSPSSQSMVKVESDNKLLNCSCHIPSSELDQGQIAIFHFVLYLPLLSKLDKISLSFNIKNWNHEQSVTNLTQVGENLYEYRFQKEAIDISQPCIMLQSIAVYSKKLSNIIFCLMVKEVYYVSAKRVMLRNSIQQKYSIYANFPSSFYLNEKRLFSICIKSLEPQRLCLRNVGVKVLCDKQQIQLYSIGDEQLLQVDLQSIKQSDDQQEMEWKRYVEFKKKGRKQIQVEVKAYFTLPHFSQTIKVVKKQFKFIAQVKQPFMFQLKSKMITENKMQKQYYASQVIALQLLVKGSQNFQIQLKMVPLTQQIANHIKFIRSFPLNEQRIEQNSVHKFQCLICSQTDVSFIFRVGMDWRREGEHPIASNNLLIPSHLKVNILKPATILTSVYPRSCLINSIIQIRHSVTGLNPGQLYFFEQFQNDGVLSIGKSRVKGNPCERGQMQMVFYNMILKAGRVQLPGMSVLNSHEQKIVIKKSGGICHVTRD